MLLEIGPGRGDFLFWLAETNPQEQVWGIEYKRKRCDKLLLRLGRKGLTNVRLLLGDARWVIPAEVPTAAVGQAYILFNDPWPKRRHSRRRLFQEGLIEELHRILCPGGEVVIATDDPRYREEIQALFRVYRSFEFSPDRLHFPTFYAQKWLAEGRTIFSFSYTKRNDAEPTLEST